MTKTYILCLANSKKYGERCIAGVQLLPDAQSQFHFVKHEGRPKWLRPVSNEDYGQVPASLVKDIAVGDILAFELVRHCPIGYQVENCLFAEGSLEKLRPGALSAPHLDQLAEPAEGALLGSGRRYLEPSEIESVRRSLVLVKPSEAQPYFTTPYHTKPRVKFRLGSIQYDLPITDVNFFDQMQEGLAALQGRTAYLTISLGIPFEGKYYKLAAGIVYC